MADFTRDLLYYGGINAYTGSMKLPGNISMDGIGSYIRDLSVDQLKVAGNAVIAGLTFDSLTITGDVISGGNFIGNGALLTGMPPSSLPTIANVDIIGNVTAPGDITVAGKIVSAGNISANYYQGNGSLLTGVTSLATTTFTANGTSITTSNLILTSNQYISITTSNSTTLNIAAAGVNTGGNLVVLSNAGYVEQDNLAGYLVVPQGYVANTQARLAIAGGNAAIGAVVTEMNTGNTYMLAASPSNVSTNWLGFNGGNFPVNTVFGRVGDVIADFGDYADNYIMLSKNVGNVLAGDSVAQALASLQNTKANIVGGNITAGYFVGNGAFLTDVKSTLPSKANIDIVGNVVAPGNISVGGQVNVVGNVVCNYIKGNGALITGFNPLSGGTLTGNLTALSGVRIFSQQMPFMWSGALFDNPTNAGPIVVATAQGTSGTYTGAQTGWMFVDDANQFSSLAWNLNGFDFRKDFQIKFSVTSTQQNAGGMWISVGGSDTGGLYLPSQLLNGQLSAYVNFQTNAVYTYYNGVAINNTSGLYFQYDSWVPFTFTVRTIAGKKYAMLSNASGGTVATCADASAWTPLGGYLVFGANTNNVAAQISMNSVSIEYL